MFSLNDVSIRKAKPKEKSYKMYDGKGLFLQVTPAGGKWWRFKYRFGGKEKLLALGTYPEVSLADARGARDNARKQVKANIDPSEVRKAEKLANAGMESFEVVARLWHDKHNQRWSTSHSDKIIRRLEMHIFPWLGSKKISEIKAPELLSVLRRIESRGHLETAHRALQNCGQVFRFAVASGLAERDPSGDLKGAIPPAKEKRMAAITDPAKVGELLRAIEGYSGTFVVQCALRLAPLVFTRPGELRKAEWSEIDFENADWRIPEKRMKMGSVHIVPLSQQALKILNELHPLTGRGKYVFPSARSDKRPMSNNAVLSALRRMGFEKDEMSGHGFRHMASTLLHESGFPSHIIEKQLSHGDRNRVRAVYNYAEYLPDRKKMMQAWANYLDALKSDTKVIPLKAAGK